VTVARQAKGPSWAGGCTLVLGAAGMLGRELVHLLHKRAEESGGRVVSWDLADLDIRDRSAVYGTIGNLRPGVVVNAAAYTDVDGCETDVSGAMAVNAQGPGHLAQACDPVGAMLVHFGTDFVFDGSLERAYRPDDVANPLSVYGRSKWEGEQAIRAASCRHLIVRSSWMFGPRGRNFVEAILAQAGAAKPLRVVNDQVGSPTLAADLADAVIRLLDAGEQGTFHFANSGQCSWFEFAGEILEQAGMDRDVEPITSEQLHRPARRPAYSALDTSKYAEATGTRPVCWQDALRRYLNGRGCLP